LFTSVAVTRLLAVIRQEALCYQWLPLLSATSRSAFHSLV